MREGVAHFLDPWRLVRQGNRFWLGLPDELEIVLDAQSFGCLQVHQNDRARLFFLDGAQVDLGTAARAPVDATEPPHRLLDRRWQWDGLKFELDPGEQLRVTHTLSERVVLVRAESTQLEVRDGERVTRFGPAPAEVRSAETRRPEVPSAEAVYTAERAEQAAPAEEAVLAEQAEPAEEADLAQQAAGQELQEAPATINDYSVGTVLGQADSLDGLTDQPAAQRLISERCSQILNRLVQHGRLNEGELRADHFSHVEVGEFKHVLMCLQSEGIDFWEEAHSSQGMVYILQACNLELHRSYLVENGWRPE